MSLAEFAGPERLDIAARATLIASAIQSNITVRELLLGAGLGVSPLDKELYPIVVVAKEHVVVGPARTIWDSSQMFCKLSRRCWALNQSGFARWARWLSRRPNLILRPDHRSARLKLVPWAVRRSGLAAPVF